jgi:hypothetical protein
MPRTKLWELRSSITSSAEFETSWAAEQPGSLTESGEFSQKLMFTLRFEHMTSHAITATVLPAKLRELYFILKV